MFTFSVITISIVGLFFQIVTALSAYFLSQQLSYGEQILKWHALSFTYACSLASVDRDAAVASGATITADDFGARKDELAGSCPSGNCIWHTKFFTGSYNGIPNKPMIITYVEPNDLTNTFSIGDLRRQLLKVTRKQFYSFGLSKADHTVAFTSYSDGAPTTISIDVPAALQTNSVVLVSDATC